MKLKLSALALLLIVITSSAFIAPLVKPVIYKVDLEKSTLTWAAKKVTGGHNGTVNLQSGSLQFEGKKLNGGNFVINMATIKDADKSAKLEGHLKADDFFGVDKFATSTFVIKKVTSGTGNQVNITGDLTIKGITNPITFPAAVVWNADGSVTATADKIVVDRTKFGIKFRSKGMFPDIGDKMIYDDFELSIKLIAKK
ncbi:YceI family protein [Pedobacter heparinus]|uniref:YceI family protein n=1 Tax=Pedobacter heparinus (strain ATCC 13125 / DSM 2366 / CIP 104194 / JCM 7457 / NBRC 12017 / NCIMB 9290 / NRRL B-14731 / HIM 762-3) TaxID=485917 RepID=C6XU78_PEDHD|nr:YceI family protein [Pedobacter heparinus]ACU05871.1 YceI family protein [Pedobacter heparinus DSM 2366]